MKMKLFFISFALLLAITCAFYLKRQSCKYDVLLLNVEALARGELGGSCWGSGSLDCPWDNVKVYRIVR